MLAGVWGTVSTKDSPAPIAIDNGKPQPGPAVVSDGHTSFMIKSDNSLWAWGANDLGQYGDGYENGEQMLRDVADYLAEATGRTVYKFVGVEFVVILEDMMQGKAEDLSEVILNRFSHMWKIGDTECLAQAQIGMTAFPGLAGSQEELIQKANEAFDKAVAAQQSGDWAAYGDYLKELQQYLNALEAGTGE